MDNQIIVTAAHPRDETLFQVWVFEQSEDAQHEVERLLEEGYDQGQIRVFKGIELRLKVMLKPVVYLAGEETGQEPTQDFAYAGPEGEEQVEVDNPDETLEKTPVRFSSLFRSDSSFK